MYENTTSDKAGGLAFWERRKTTSFDWNKQCAYKSQRVALGQRRKIGSIRSQCRSNLELLEIRRHGIVLFCFARLALGPFPLVLADIAPSALPALAPYPILVDTEAASSVIPALMLFPMVLADARPSALLASAPSPTVLASDCPCTRSFSDCAGRRADAGSGSRAKGKECDDAVCMSCDLVCISVFCRGARAPRPATCVIVWL